MTNGSLDERLERLVTATERTAQNLEQVDLRQQNRHEQAMAELARLREVTQSQAAVAQQQAENIRNLAAIVSELTRSVSTFSRENPALLATSREGVRSSQTTELLSVQILEELRTLIQVLRARE